MVAGIMDFSYNFVDSSGHNNGNVQRITNNNAWTRTQNFTYDSLNRISTAYTNSDNQPAYSGDTGSIAACWAETYTYDPWGNLTSLGPNSTTQPNYVGCTQESGFNYTSAGQITTKNQIAAYCYDAAGNLVLETTCPTGTFTPAFQYDAENHLISSAAVTYTYDGDGKRVMKSNGTIYWYGASSDAFLETDLSANLKYQYFFFNGQRVGRQDGNNSVTWYFGDHLGSSRVVWSTAATDNSDFYPFGGERVIASGTANTYKFTGKERDSESGLDNFGARYNVSTLGRFMSPDPVGIFVASESTPQSWNLYSYVLNNPLKFADPLGLWCVWQDGTHDDNPEDGGVDDSQGCLDQGGLWDQTNTLTGCDMAWNCTAGSGGPTVQGCSDTEDSCLWQPGDSITVSAKADNGSPCIRSGSLSAATRLELRVLGWLAQRSGGVRGIGVGGSGAYSPATIAGGSGSAQALWVADYLGQQGLYWSVSGGPTVGEPGAGFVGGIQYLT